ncbi:MAG: glycosyltransferase [Phycisphaeraceae bacterium]
MDDQVRTSPRVSLVITLYNRAGYVAEAIESVLAQTFEDWELVVWDDGSTDGSGEIARGYAERDERVRYVRDERNRGMYFALHDGLALTAGGYLGWVDSDDRLLAGALERCVGVLEARAEVGMVYTDHVEMDEEGRELRVGGRCGIPYSKNRLLRDFMTFHFRLMRREVLEAAGGIDVRFGYAEDYDLCLRVSEVTEVEHLREVLYAYRVHQQSISRASRLGQIEGSATAVRRALRRRGLETRYDLVVELVPRFHVVPIEGD